MNIDIKTKTLWLQMVYSVQEQEHWTLNIILHGNMKAIFVLCTMRKVKLWNILSTVLDIFIYGEPFDENWTNIYDENSDQQFLIQQFILKRCRIRENIFKQQGDGQASDVGSTAPGTLLS